MSSSFYDLMKYAKLGIASPDMTMYDRLKASALFGGTAPDKTITGIPPLTLTAKKAGAATSYKLTGKTVQDGTPTPDAPIEIKGVGDRTANLFDGSISETSGYLNSEGNVFISSAFNISDYIPCDAETTYTLSNVNDDSKSPSVCFYSHQKEFLGGVEYNKKSGATFTTPSGCVLLKVSYRKDRVTVAMLNLGSTVLPYEQYGYKATITSNGATAATLYTDKPLYGTGDVLDEYDSTGKIVRKWRELVFDGSEDWSIAGNTPGYTPYFRIAIFMTAKASKVVCTHYTSPDENISIRNNVIGIKVQTSTEFDIVLIVRPPEYAVWSVSDFKAYLAAQYAAGTPVTVIYQLATPTEETITAPSLMLSKGVNVIDADTTIKPYEMSITGQIK